MLTATLHNLDHLRIVDNITNTMIFSTKFFVKKLVLFLFFFFISNVLVSSSSLGNKGVKCIDSEREALLKFKYELIDDYGRLSTWGSEEQKKDCCKWTGIKCDNGTNHVVSLDLKGTDDTRLSGNISPVLLELSDISYLDLGNNDFNTIPEFIGSFKKLQYLNLSNEYYSRFSGIIPPQLGNLSMLQALDLSGNVGLYVEDLDWLSGLHSLQHLDLSYVDLKKVATWLQPISKLTQLKKLYMSACSVKETLSNSFPTATNESTNSLMFLDLSLNNLKLSTFLWFLNFSSNYRYIDFSDNDLSGKVPDGLTKQMSLSYLDLSFSKLKDDLPHMTEFLRESTMLENLDLRNNRLYGSIPPLSRFPFLNKLSLSKNQLNGSFTDTELRLPCLKVLDVAKNRLTGRLPDFTSFSSLADLRLSENKFNGTLTETIGHLSQIPYLDLHSNDFEGVISEAHLFNLSTLQYLDLSYNSNLTVRISSDWSLPFQLTTLYLANCNIGPSFPKWLQNQTQIWDLDISNSQIYDLVPGWFWGNFHSLSFLNMSFNHIYGVIPNANMSTGVLDLSFNEFNGSLPRLFSPLNFNETRVYTSTTPLNFNEYSVYTSTNVNLSGNKFSGEINEFCSAIYGFTRFDLSDNILSGELSEVCFMILKTFEYVNLGNNNLSGEIPKQNSSSCALTALHLRNNSFRGHFPLSIRECHDLDIIDIGNNYFTEEIPTWLGESFPRLSVLSLRSNIFRGTMPSSLCFLAQIEILDISMNDISGTIPRCLKNFTRMWLKPFTNVDSFRHNIVHGYGYATYIKWKGRETEFAKTLWMVKAIDLSSNHLVGEIPREITRLLGLISLDLSRNHLVGSIPRDIDKLKYLDILDLSENNLSGHIPVTLSRLNELGWMNLSFNNLSGKIPWSTHLETFDINVFSGNPQLCGPPLLKLCPGDQVPQIPKSKIHSDAEDNLDTYITKGFYISMAVGFILAFWGTFGTLNFNRTCRIKFSKLLMALDDWWYVKIQLNKRKLQRYFQNQ